MWAMTSFGILMPAIRPPRTVQWGDDRTMQIRARRPQDLNILRAKYMQGRLGRTIHTPDKDYEYRAYCTPEAFAVAMMQMILEIDYLKFKPTTDKYEDWELHRCYNSIWSTVLRELSAPQHQDDYWRKHPVKTTPVTPAAKTTGTGYVEKANGSGVSAQPDLHTEHARLEKWFEDADRRDNPSGRNVSADRDDDLSNGGRFQSDWAQHLNGSERNTSADRDDYLPDGSSVDSWVESDAAMSSSNDGVNEQVDALYGEIDAILEAQKVIGPINHIQCRHADTPNAKAKCRGKHRRAEQRRIEQLRAEITQAYKDAEADYAATTSSDDPDSWKGYVWERKSQDGQYAL